MSQFQSRLKVSPDSQVPVAGLPSINDCEMWGFSKEVPSSNHWFRISFQRRWAILGIDLCLHCAVHLFPVAVGMCLVNLGVLWFNKWWFIVKKNISWSTLLCETWCEYYFTTIGFLFVCFFSLFSVWDKSKWSLLMISNFVELEICDVFRHSQKLRERSHLSKKRWLGQQKHDSVKINNRCERISIVTNPVSEMIRNVDSVTQILGDRVTIGQDVSLVWTHFHYHDQSNVDRVKLFLACFLEGNLNVFFRWFHIYRQL